MHLTIADTVAIMSLVVMLISGAASFVNDKENIETLRQNRSLKKNDVALTNSDAANANVEAAMMLIGPLKEKLAEVTAERDNWKKLYLECCEKTASISV